MTKILIHPKVTELLKKYESLKDELSKIIEEKDLLVNHIIPSIYADYQLKIGVKKFELFCLECNIRRLKRSIELVQSFINNDLKFDIIEIERELDEEFFEWQQKMNDLYIKILEAQLRNDCDCLSEEESIELKKTYRSLVMKLHPDINPLQNENMKKLWLQVLIAYQNADIQTLRTLEMLIEKDLENINISELTPLEELESKCSKLKEEIIKFVDQIYSIKNSFPYEIKDKLSDKSWVEMQNIQIESQIKVLTPQKLALEAILAEFCI